MSKIKFLLAFTVTLSILYAIHFLSSIFGHNIFQYYETETMEQKIVFATVLLMEISIFIALVLISISLSRILKSGVFTSTAAYYLKIGGYLFLSVSFVDFIYTFCSILKVGSLELWLQRIFTNVLLLLLGLTAVIISDILHQGSFIKKENDLTI